MTREKALEISKALDAIDTFECVMDEIESAIIHAEEYADISNFKVELRLLMLKEYERRKNYLESL